MNDQPALELEDLPRRVAETSDILRTPRLAPAPLAEGTDPPISAPDSQRAGRAIENAPGSTSVGDPTPIDERAAFHLWLRSIERGLAGYQRRFAPTVRDRVSAKEAESLWEFLVATEKSFSLHVFGGEDSAFSRLSEGEPDVNQLALDFEGSVSELAGSLRIYRKTARWADQQEELRTPSSLVSRETEIHLSQDSDAIVEQLRKMATALGGIVRTVKNFVPERRPSG